MITKLRLINFRNFEEKVLDFLNKENFIIGENGKGKTNILEALSLLCNNSILSLTLDQLIKKGKNYFFIEYITDLGDKISFSYFSEKKKKIFMLNNNKITFKEFKNITYSCVIFSPIIMNIMYLSPDLRRKFLDDLLKNSFSGYEKLLYEYKKIVKNRNKILKSIKEGLCSKKELNYWDIQFIEKSNEIYKYRFKIVNFLKETISTTLEYFSGKILTIDFIYISKISETNIKNDIELYLKTNLDRDIILGKSPIGPHVDDFEILIDGVKLINFASRGETKSIILWMKLMEGIFIEKMTGKKPILLIDDLLSELDKTHKDMLLKKIKYYQIFISSITEPQNKNLIKLI